MTANRWARLLRDLGHQVIVAEELPGRCDALVAIHALKSHAAAKRFRKLHPVRPLFLLLSGTDVYGDLKKSAKARESLELADRILILQPEAASELPKRLHPKVRITRQSARRLPESGRPSSGAFEVCVLAHLRSVKDPFRAALAARRLPAESRIRVTHLGAATTEALRRRADSEEARNPRYRWLGVQSARATLRRLRRSHLLVLTSKMEGGANAVSEAIVAGVPVLSSRISGSVGMLGRDYPGYFEVGDTAELAALLYRAETDAIFLGNLRDRVRKLAPLYRPAAERDTWRKLLQEFGI